MNKKLTKTAILFFLTFLCTSNISAQNYLITFSGSGQSNTVETVEVKNIAQQTTLTLSGTDTLLLTDVVGTGYLPSLSHGMIIYPNPANHASRLVFSNSSAGNISIEVYDFSGRLLISNSSQLAAGSHAFSISGLHAGIYLVKVNTPEHIYSRRLVSTSVLQLAPEIHYVGTDQSRQQEPDLKSISNVVAMQYNDGERLVFKAISGDYTHTKSLIPTESQNIDFEFMDCIDGDENHYGVVTIGEQVWMAENLKTTHYRNGISIQYPGASNTVWQSNTTGAYAWYDNDISWKESYGALYNWYAVTNTNGLCPMGWYTPSHTEWLQLVDFIASQGFLNQLGNQNGASNALKSCRQTDSPLGGNCNTTVNPCWNSHSTHHGFDAFGYAGLPGGDRIHNGVFYSMGSHAYWWSATQLENWPAYAYGCKLQWANSEVSNGYTYKAEGKSVRCIKTID